MRGPARPKSPIYLPPSPRPVGLWQRVKESEAPWLTALLVGLLLSVLLMTVGLTFTVYVAAVSSWQLATAAGVFSLVVNIAYNVGHARLLDWLTDECVRARGRRGYYCR